MEAYALSGLYNTITFVFQESENEQLSVFLALKIHLFFFFVQALKFPCVWAVVHWHSIILK